MGWNQHGGPTDLHIIRNGTLTGRENDNARPHRARLVENMLKAKTIQRMEWPACSPDLNPIEHVWDMLGRGIATRPRPPATVRDLEIALLEEWNSIPQSLIHNIIASMANRVKEVRKLLFLSEAMDSDSVAGSDNESLVKNGIYISNSLHALETVKNYLMLRDVNGTRAFFLCTKSKNVN
ncbi:transposable element Tcb2 transposase [Trichonephila clavipes]|nr:transposable element Tcb2 transposase [Trichonephila clavipes]